MNHPKLKRPVATGTRRPHDPGMVIINIRLDEETFQEVRKLAIANKVSFGSKIRELIEFGLEDTKGVSDAA